MKKAASTNVVESSASLCPVQDVVSNVRFTDPPYNVYKAVVVVVVFLDTICRLILVTRVESSKFSLPR